MGILKLRKGTAKRNSRHYGRMEPGSCRNCHGKENLKININGRYYCDTSCLAEWRKGVSRKEDDLDF